MQDRTLTNDTPVKFIVHLFSYFLFADDDVDDGRDLDIFDINEGMQREEE